MSTDTTATTDFRVRQVARDLGVAHETVLLLIESGEFPGCYNATATGSRKEWRIPAADVTAFKERRAAVPAQKQKQRRRRRWIVTKDWLNLNANE